jgi:hypothetical protein
VCFTVTSNEPDEICPTDDQKPGHQFLFFLHTFSLQRLFVRMSLSAMWSLVVPAPFRIIDSPNITSFQSVGKYAEWRFSETKISSPFAFEIFEWEWWADYVAENWDFCIYVGAIYLAAIFGLQRAMRDRPPFQLKRALALWNGALGVFSILGFTRSWPAFWNILSVDNGFYHSICSRLVRVIDLCY